MAELNTPFHFSKQLPPVFDATTLHVIGSYHDPTTCKVSGGGICRMARYWPFGALTRLVIEPNMVKFVFVFPNGFPGICGTDTLNAFRSWYDPTTCKVSTETIQFWATFWPSCAPPQLPGSAQNDQTSLYFFPNGFSLVCDADTLHVVGSYHDPITCKVSAQNSLF
jgi:hypothetical protein